MTSEEIREKFLKYFEERGHTRVPSSSLVSEDDASVLFTTAGMQQFKPYYTGVKDPQVDFGSYSTTSAQKCIRTSDIEEVGDDTHLTFFEMLGNFSFGKGAYFKKEAIAFAHEFITKEMGLTIDYVSIFQGEEGVPRDDGSERIWKSLDPEIEVREFGREDNFWGPTGDEGPCGPTTEVYVNGVEIWNIVFNEYYCDIEKNLTPLEQKGVDTGMGLERLLVHSNGVESIYETDLFTNILREASKLTEDTRSQRIIAEHVRSAIFMIADGVIPSNTDRGYILRRLLRRTVTRSDTKKIEKENIKALVGLIIEKYSGVYRNLKDNTVITEESYIEESSNPTARSITMPIISVIETEIEKFERTIEKGLKEFEKMKSNGIDGKEAFILFSTYGFPLELTQELAKENGIKVDVNEFEKEMQKHKEASRTASAGMFKGGLQDHSEKSLKYHTATHLLLAGLRAVLGEHVEQRGSNINEERLRLDFTHPEKMTDEQKDKVEDFVNNAISQNLPVSFSEMSVEEAKEMGALGVFEDKYGDKVKVYKVSDLSMEICGGPHVERTGEMGTFRIKKEESVSAGVRRIKAVLE